jgi:hypothetical protein
MLLFALSIELQYSLEYVHNSCLPPLRFPEGTVEFSLTGLGSFCSPHCPLRPQPSQSHLPPPPDLETRLYIRKPGAQECECIVRRLILLVDVR